MTLPATGAPLVIGFDLDMTLVDPRPGVRAGFEALMAETGVVIDIDAVIARLGPPLEVELTNWVDAERVEEMGDALPRPLFRAGCARHRAASRCA